METREFEVRAVDAEARTVSGIAVPFNQVIEVGGIKESFDSGAIRSIENVKLFYGHSEPIGLVTKGEDTEDGFLIEARISETPKGDEVRTLLKDGVLNKFSVGFVPVTTEEREGVFVRTEVDLKEVSVVAFPAYNAADVLSVRNENTENMEETTMETNSNDVADLREAVDNLERKFDVVTTQGAATTLPTFRSFGDYVQATARGDENAEALYRAFANTADSVVKDAWVSDVYRLVALGRPTINAFSTSALPGSGLNVEYPVVTTNTVATAAQAAQGDALTYGELTLGSATAAVATYGGYTSMSRQVIERSTVQYLDTAFKAMALGYAKATNAAARTALVAGNANYNAADASAQTIAVYVSAVVEACAEIYENSGLNADFVLVSTDVYKDIVGKLDGSNRPVIAAGNPSNNLGAANVASLSANFMGIPIVLDTTLPVKSMYVASKEAFVTYESAGAPLQLAAEDVTKLTRDFSVYGYAAFAIPTPKGISVIDVTA